MPARALAPAVLPAALLAALVGVAPAAEPAVHRNGFAGRDPFFVPADATVAYQEKAHRISDEHCKNAPTSEYIKIEAGAAEDGHVHYAYPLPPAPVSDRLVAGVWVKAYRPGVRLKARVVLPKERDPANPDAPLTTVVLGDAYRNVRQWQPLGMGNVPDLLRKTAGVLTARLRRPVDTTDAYLDRLVLDVYAGPGVTEVWVDDLEVGPVRADAPPPPGAKPPAAARPAGRGPPPAAARQVKFDDGRLKVTDDKGRLEPFFMLAIRSTGAPLKVLRDALFNTVWFPGDPDPAAVAEAVRQGFWVVPALPVPAGAPDDGSALRPSPDEDRRDADKVAGFLQRFRDQDAVLMWDLGGGRTREDAGRVARAADVLKQYDRGRPRAVDAWDGFDDFEPSVEAIGTHRWPLFTSLELSAYRDWLSQRRSLMPPGRLHWTWVQTHVPDWYVNMVAGRADPAALTDPVGPHPEQIRLLTYLSLAAGCQGLGFWSDEFLSNPLYGRDRLLELALLNTEIEMLKPVLAAAQGPAKWFNTSHPHVQAAVIRGPNEVLVLPVYLGPGAQHCPPQGAFPGLTVNVPQVPDGAIPWLVTAAGVSEVKGARRVAAGTEITIPEFDLTAAVVFTSDVKLDGKVVKWQDDTRNRVGELAAKWAVEQAKEQYAKTTRTHARIEAAGGPPVPEARGWLGEYEQSMRRAQEYTAVRQWEGAYKEARRAQRPLRLLMRRDWDQATDFRILDVPTASPYAASFYSLPQHWALQTEVRAGRVGRNVLEYGDFDLSRPAPLEGAAVTSLPGWSVRKPRPLDRVVPVAALVNAEPLEAPEVKKLPRVPVRYGPERMGAREVVPTPRKPDLGTHALMLQMLTPAQAEVELAVRGRQARAAARAKQLKGKQAGGRAADPPTEAETAALQKEAEQDRKDILAEKARLDAAPPRPQALERSVLAVDSPAVDLPPGSLARVSFWVRVDPYQITPVLEGVAGSADGVVVYDSAGGEPLGVRLVGPWGWKEYHLYRRVPEGGKLSVTFALTGLGTVYFDDVRIEPIVPPGGRSPDPAADPDRGATVGRPAGRAPAGTAGRGR